MSLAMTREEREAFLAGVHVAVLALPEPGRGPLAVPIWYAYEPGGQILLVTEAGSRKGRLLRERPRVSLVVQDETPPYRYVSVEGPVVGLEPADLERHTRPLAHRYLGPERGDAYLAATGDEEGRGGSIAVFIRPERWLTVDYRKAWGDG